MGTLLVRGAELVVTMDGGRARDTARRLFARDGIIELVAADEELPMVADHSLDLRGQILLPDW